MRQESHRVFWQQRVGGDPSSFSREWISSSAAIRISEAARAKDVTQLLRKTLSLPFPVNASEKDADSLVLVGTLHDASPIVRFEHEPPPPLAESMSEPFHVLRSLSPQEHPLVVRDEMVECLKQRYNSVGGNSQQLQWFFAPGTEPSGNIPNLVHLDGYCTSMEEENYDESDTDSEQDTHDCKRQIPRESSDNNNVPWWKIEKSRRVPRASQRPHDDDSSFTQMRRVAREQRRLAQLSSCRSALDHHCVSGFLLKQSPRDAHVWRRVHCVLTDDHLWFVSRIYNNRIARHGRVALSRASLVELERSRHYRIPFVFEVVSSCGTLHVFRTQTKSLQLRWMACIRERLAQCQDNRLMEHAELIVEGETLARNKRLSELALPAAVVHCVGGDGWKDLQIQKTVMNLVRFGMQVASYREHCRHIQVVLPAKTPIVTVSSSSNRQQQQPQDVLPSHNGPSSRTTPPTELPSPKRLLDPETRSMVRSAWDEAALLLTGATQIAFALPGGTLKAHGGSKRLTRSVETICRHVDYVITGRFRPLNESGVFVDGAHHARVDLDDPPPTDLFDQLLAELQKLAATIDDKSKLHAMNGTSNGGS